ncbi:response regulator [Geomesophilobacter sediminis]|uniref:Response regulator n=1 Tax=Geomesophilobacter sediminis TaxID=2798584 RepID=A0A8J7IZ43_9BACT|nr:response regulator [Geomesophilobacter sediminis]MBJ6723268.1 response regulator [Geomesophilobacter sediminis]
MDKRVMIVDDNDFVRDSVEMFFSTEGMEVHSAASGFDCLKHLENGFRGVLLLDIQMPGMDGWETLRRITERDLHRDNTIIILTARIDSDCDDPELRRHVADYIQKPFNPNELLQIVKKYVEAPPPEQEAAFG